MSDTNVGQADFLLTPCTNEWDKTIQFSAVLLNSPNVAGLKRLTSDCKNSHFGGFVNLRKMYLLFDSCHFPMSAYGKNTFWASVHHASCNTPCNYSTKVASQHSTVSRGLGIDTTYFSNAEAFRHTALLKN